MHTRADNTEVPSCAAYRSTSAYCCSHVIYVQQLLTQEQRTFIFSELEHLLSVFVHKMRAKLGAAEPRTLDKFT